MGDPSSRYARRAEPQQSCESALDAFTLAVQCGGCGVSVSDSGREHGFGAPRLPALRSVRTARGSERPRPRLQRHAPRLGGSINTGGFPGRRVATRIHAAAASPFGLSEPASDAEWPVVPWRGVCPRDIAISAIAALDCAFRRPRRLQPTTLPVAALWMAASYHPVTRASLGKFLSRSLPPLARRPILAPVTTRFAPIRTRNAGRAVTGMRAKPRPSQGSAGVARGTTSAQSAGGAAGAAERQAGFGPDLAKPTAWAALGIVVPAPLVRTAGVDRAGRLQAARRTRRSPAHRARGSGRTGPEPRHANAPPPSSTRWERFSEGWPPALACFRTRTARPASPLAGPRRVASRANLETGAVRHHRGETPVEATGTREGDACRA